ncbi:MAG: chemotaxis protein CheX [Desulfobacula sp.]|nr:chemotaxis protein CheX [Desulfobacula sp.]
MKTLMTAMMTSISEVMETMFFLPVEFGKETKAINEKMQQYKPDMACQLKFSGDVSGNITLLIPESLLGEMAENFMGTPKEELTSEHISGTLTEILNMVCGNALGKVESKVPFELDIPKMIDESKISDSLLFNIIQTPDAAMALNISLD